MTADTPRAGRRRRDSRHAAANDSRHDGRHARLMTAADTPRLADHAATADTLTPRLTTADMTADTPGSTTADTPRPTTADTAAG